MTGRMLAVQSLVADDAIGDPVVAQRLIDAIGFVGDLFKARENVAICDASLSNSVKSFLPSTAFIFLWS